MVFFWSVIACNQNSDNDTAEKAELPPESTPSHDSILDTGTPWEWEDTGTPDQNREPDHHLYLYQDGLWELSPSNGPYTAVTGTLTVLEWLDMERPEDSADTGVNPALLCSLSYALTGTSLEEVCEGCEFGFEVSFYLTEGDPESCHDTSLPRHEAIWRLAFHEREELLLLDFGNSGNWLPWYSASQLRDTVLFSWYSELGFVVEEEE
jgi:hypothetical protein